MPNTQCSHCAKQYKVPQNAAGRGTNCLHCGKSFIIQFVETPAPQPAAGISKSKTAKPAPASAKYKPAKKAHTSNESAFEQVEVPERLSPAFDEQPSESPTVHIDQGFEAEVVDINEVDDFVEVNDLVKEYDQKKAKPPTMFKPLGELASVEVPDTAIPVSETPTRAMHSADPDDEPADTQSDTSDETAFEADETSFEETSEDADISIEPDLGDTQHDMADDELDTSEIEDAHEDDESTPRSQRDTEIDWLPPAKRAGASHSNYAAHTPPVSEDVSMAKFAAIAVVLAAVGTGLGWAVFTFLL